MNESIFDQIMNVVSPASHRAIGNPKAQADLIEALATGLGRSIARMAHEDASTMERLLVGAEHHMVQEAFSTASFVSTLKGLAGNKDPHP